MMALQEIPHLNQSAFLKLKAPNLYVVAMAKFFASFNDFGIKPALKITVT